jgi:hypothetical protein
MKTVKYLCVLLVLGVVGCDESPDSYTQNDGLATKTIVAKESPIENRLSGTEILFGSGSITKSETVYYLIAEDGTIVETDIVTWAKVKIGESYTTRYWKKT